MPPLRRSSPLPLPPHQLRLCQLNEQPGWVLSLDELVEGPGQCEFGEYLNCTAYRCPDGGHADLVGDGTQLADLLYEVACVRRLLFYGGAQLSH